LLGDQSDKKLMSATTDGKPFKSTGITRVIRAFFYSMEGLGSSLKHEAAFRQEAILAVLLLPLAIFLPVSLLGKALLIGSVFLVLIVELLNSGIEWAIDYISLENHPFAKRAKDMGSAAVFLSLTNCVCLWALVLWDRFG
jgi:diacylglycerol kinase (ATP)